MADFKRVRKTVYFKAEIGDDVVVTRGKYDGIMGEVKAIGACWFTPDNCQLTYNVWLISVSAQCPVFLRDEDFTVIRKDKKKK